VPLRRASPNVMECWVTRGSMSESHLYAGGRAN
jgi:hypothetical protein